MLSSPDATDSDLDSQPLLSASAQSAAEEPAAPVASVERGPLERLDAWPVLDPITCVCIGEIVWNKNARSLDANCQCPTHRTVAERRRRIVNRTVNTPKRPGVAGGRPLGFLLAWLHSASRRSAREEHFVARHGPDVSFERRSHFRAMVLPDPRWVDALAKEREPHPGEGAEPRALP